MSAELTDHLGYWMRGVSNAVSHAFASKLADKGVTVAEWVVLRTLHGQGAINPSELADQMHTTRGTISKLADRLLAKELITRTDDPDDRRAHTLRLTPKGRRLVPMLAALADENDAEFFGHLTATQRRDLRTLLEELSAHHGLTSPPID
jgi:DNA-binding MarR family transcriptional regulator